MADHAFLRWLHKKHPIAFDDIAFEYRLSRWISRANIEHDLFIYLVREEVPLQHLDLL